MALHDVLADALEADSYLHTCVQTCAWTCVYVGMCHVPSESSRRGGRFEHRHAYTHAMHMPSAMPKSAAFFLQAQKEQVMALHDVFADTVGVKTPMGVFQTNSIQRGASTASVMCATISRFNHSCRPNVSHAWAAPHGRVYANRDIKEGEELCTQYCDLMQPARVRRKIMRAQYGFDCFCEACTGADSAASDRRRQRIQWLSEKARLDLLFCRTESRQCMHVRKVRA